MRFERMTIALKETCYQLQSGLTSENKGLVKRKNPKKLIKAKQTGKKKERLSVWFRISYYYIFNVIV